MVEKLFLQLPSLTYGGKAAAMNKKKTVQGVSNLSAMDAESKVGIYEDRRVQEKHDQHTARELSPFLRVGVVPFLESIEFPR